MADCLPLITPEFLHTVTGVDISDTATVESLIIITSTLIGEELGGCVDPDTASMKLRVVCAEYTAYCMTSGAGGGTDLRAEQIGDYRVEYQSSNKNDSFDLQVLREMLQSMHGASTYTVTTTDVKANSGVPFFDSFDPGWDEVAEGERIGIAGPMYGSDGSLGLPDDTPTPPDLTGESAPGAPGTPFVGYWADMQDGTWQYNLEWTAPVDDGGAPVLHYQVWLEGVTTATPDENPIQHNNVINDNAIHVAFVQAVNEVGVGAASEMVTITTPPRVPGSPTAPIPGNWNDNGDGSWDYTLSWNFPTYEGSHPITSSRVLIDGVLVAEVDEPQAFVGLTTTDLAFTASVECVNSEGIGPASSDTIAVPGTLPGAPDIPVIVGQKRDPDKPGWWLANLTWTPSPDEGASPVTHFQVYIEDLMTPTPGPISYIENMSMQGGVHYAVYIRAVNPYGAGESSPVADLWCPP